MVDQILVDRISECERGNTVITYLHSVMQARKGTSNEVIIFTIRDTVIDTLAMWFLAAADASRKLSMFSLFKANLEVNLCP